MYNVQLKSNEIYWYFLGSARLSQYKVQAVGNSNSHKNHLCNYQITIGIAVLKSCKFILEQLKYFRS